MRFLPFRTAVLAGAAWLTAAGCGDSRSSDSKPSAAVTAKSGGASGGASADTAPAARPWELKPIVVPPDPAPAARLAADSLVSDSLGAREPIAPALALGQKRRFALTPADSARWPVKGPAPLPGSLLPDHRIIAYYGNPKSTRMGVLGQLPAAEMLPRLERTATEWARAEPGREIVPALHLIATVAQGKPGAGGKYRLRHSDQLIEQVLGWAEERGWVVFLDVQIGHSTVADELPHLVKYLERPYVHLALDPEFAMKLGGVPGRRIGTLDAEDVNYAARLLAGIVDRKKLPPKVLVVHRFTQRMLTNSDRIKLDPRVQVVVDMDGFGAPWLKQDGYKFFIVPEPVQFTGFKLFYKNDRIVRGRGPESAAGCSKAVYETVGCGDDGLMTPKQVLKLYPQPLYIQYQ